MPGDRREFSNCNASVPSVGPRVYVVKSSSDGVGTIAEFTFGYREHITLKPISGPLSSIVKIIGIHFG